MARIRFTNQKLLGCLLIVFVIAFLGFMLIRKDSSRNSNTKRDVQKTMQQTEGQQQSINADLESCLKAVDSSEDKSFEATDALYQQQVNQCHEQYRQ